MAANTNTNTNPAYSPVPTNNNYWGAGSQPYANTPPSSFWQSPQNTGVVSTPNYNSWGLNNTGSSTTPTTPTTTADHSASTTGSNGWGTGFYTPTPTTRAGD